MSIRCWLLRLFLTVSVPSDYESYFQYYYNKPYTRYGPYLLGILTGIYMTTKTDALIKQKVTNPDGARHKNLNTDRSVKLHMYCFSVAGRCWLDHIAHHIDGDGGMCLPSDRSRVSGPRFVSRSASHTLGFCCGMGHPCL